MLQRFAAADCALSQRRARCAAAAERGHAAGDHAPSKPSSRRAPRRLARGMVRVAWRIARRARHAGRRSMERSISSAPAGRDVGVGSCKSPGVRCTFRVATSHACCFVRAAHRLRATAACRMGCVLHVYDGACCTLDQLGILLLDDNVQPPDFARARLTRCRSRRDTCRQAARSMQHVATQNMRHVALNALRAPFSAAHDRQQAASGVWHAARSTTA